MTPAAGWTVVKQGSNFAVLLNAQQTAQMLITTGKGQSSNISQDLASDIQSAAKDFTDLKLGQAEQPATINGKNFQQGLAVTFQATISTQQGTGPVFGGFAELLNPSSGLSAFVEFIAPSPSEFKRNTPDAQAMISSAS